MSCVVARAGRGVLVAGAVAMVLALVGCAPPTLPARPPAASAAADPAHEMGFFAGAGGVRLFEQSWHAEHPRAVIVIHHGLKSHSHEYEEFAKRMVALGYSVYAYDMRGHGRSAGMRASLDDFDDLIDDLSIFMARVRAREPGRPVFLIGHSVGGAVVTLYTVVRHPPLAGLVLLAPALRVDRPPLLAGATPLSATLTPNLPAVDVPDEAFSRDPARRAEMARDPLLYHPPGPARTAGGLLAALERVWAHPEAIEVPLIALHGTADRATDPRGSAEIVRRAHTPDRTLVLYRGLYHDLFHEPERDQVMTDVSDWIVKRTRTAVEAIRPE